MANAGIRVVCRGCAREVDSAEVDRQVRCAPCSAVASCGELLGQYERLWAKRERYLRARWAASTQVEKALARQVQRLAERLHGRISNVELARETLNGALEGARQRATGGGRVLVSR